MGERAISEIIGSTFARGKDLRPQMTSRRGFEDIVASIIAACKEGERKTKIMYSSMLNLRQVNKYLDILATKGFVAVNREERSYVATLRGMRYLSEYEDMVKNSRQMSALRSDLSSMLASWNRRGSPERDGLSEAVQRVAAPL